VTFVSSLLILRAIFLRFSPFGQIVYAALNAVYSDVVIEEYALSAMYLSLFVSVRQTEDSHYV